MLIVGERINSTRKRIARAIEEKDTRFIQREAAIQAEAGADYIDVNAGNFLEKEVELLEWLVQVVQQAVDRPLCIDSPNPKAVAAALKLHRGKAMVNSITAERERYSAGLPLVKEYQSKVVALCIDDSGMPSTVAGKVEIASQIIHKLTADGVALDDIYIDPLVRPISVDLSSGAVFLDAIEQIMSNYPGVHTICGLSNISFGLPTRRQLNQVFTVMAMERGLDAAILDPCDKRLMADMITAETLLGKDEYCRNYIAAHREGRLETGSDG